MTEKLPNDYNAVFDELAKPETKRTLDILIKNAHTMADFVHGGGGYGPIKGLHMAIDRMADLLQNQQQNIQGNIPAPPIDPLELIKNPLTPYGLLVRALRIVAGTTLMDMSRYCGQTPAYLSGIEVGRNVLSPELITKTHEYFLSKGVFVTLGLLETAAKAEAWPGRGTGSKS